MCRVPSAKHEHRTAGAEVKHWRGESKAAESRQEGVLPSMAHVESHQFTEVTFYFLSS